MTGKTKEKRNLENPHFLRCKTIVESEIFGCIERFGKKTKLRDACEYALTNGGKRFRPLIVLMVSDALGNGLDVRDAALSVEFFHTASLIADDLPCMDNDDERRDKPSLHKVYGETIALLSTYALMTAAFEAIHKNSLSLKKSPAPFGERANEACSLALECAARCSGISGATGGQFLDLYPPTLTVEAIKDVIYKKTVTLFEVSFVFGWLFGGGDISSLDRVKTCAYHLGMAFQIADDLGDVLQDEKKEKEISIVKKVGMEKSYEFFLEEMASFEACLKDLSIYTQSFMELSDRLREQAARDRG